MTDEQNQPTGATGLFLYCIVPSDVEPVSGATGVGSGPIAAIRRGDIAALVSEVRLDEPISQPADVTAYQQLLDATAAVAPVLPIRFGTVVAGESAVDDLLGAQHDQFAAALGEFEGRVQYTVHGRFDEQAFLGGLLAEDSTAAELADQVRGRSEAESREERIRLGEMIARAVEVRQEAESRDLAERVGRHAVANVARPVSHEMDAVNLAFLVDLDGEEEFIHAVEDFAEQRRELIRMRLLGPMAPYDFVAQPAE